MATRTPASPDRVREANETEKRLRESALSLFSEKGYDGASIREIIERAGVTRPVLYYYFVNKEDLFRRLVESWLNEAIAEADRELALVSGFRERLRTLIRNAFEHAERSPEAVRLLLQVFFSPSPQGPIIDKDQLWERRFERVVAIMCEGVASGELVECDPERLAMAFCGMMDLYIMAKCHNPETDLSKELADEVVELFLNGALPRADRCGATVFRGAPDGTYVGEAVETAGIRARQSSNEGSREGWSCED